MNQVRAIYKPYSPTTCTPSFDPAACVPKGTFVVGQNSFQLVDTGLALPTDVTKCSSEGDLYAIGVRNPRVCDDDPCPPRITSYSTHFLCTYI